MWTFVIETGGVWIRQGLLQFYEGKLNRNFFSLMWFLVIVEFWLNVAWNMRLRIQKNRLIEGI